MRTSKIAIGVARPRIRVVQALVRGFLRVRTRVHPPAARRRSTSTGSTRTSACAKSASGKARRQVHVEWWL